MGNKKSNKSQQQVIYSVLKSPIMVGKKNNTFTISFGWTLSEFDKILRETNNKIIFKTIFELHKDNEEFRNEWIKLHKKIHLMKKKEEK